MFINFKRYCDLPCYEISSVEFTLIFSGGNAGVEAAQLAIAKAQLIRQMTNSMITVGDTVCKHCFELYFASYFKKEFKE